MADEESIEVHFGKVGSLMDTFQFKIIMRLLLHIARCVTRFPDELTLIERDYRRYLADRKL